MRRSPFSTCARAAVSALVVAGALALPGVSRAATLHYWVAAVPVTWNVVPTAHDPIEGTRFTRRQRVLQTVVYRRYTRNWRTPFGRRAGVDPDNGGIPGPLLRARVGDTVLVHFKNLDHRFRRPHSMHFHGVRYGFESDGSFIPGFSGPGANVRPGHSFTYRLVAETSSAGVWPYHDHSPSMTPSIAGGLYGALSILPRYAAWPDREFVVFFESTLGFNTIDGRAFLGSTPVFHARRGEVVQWDVLSLGDDFHTFHVHGHRWREADGSFRDTKTIGPAESFSVRWREEEPGTWLYHCHVEGHMMNGMIGIYRVAR